MVDARTQKVLGRALARLYEAEPDAGMPEDLERLLGALDRVVGTAGSGRPLTAGSARPGETVRNALPPVEPSWFAA